MAVSAQVTPHGFVAIEADGAVFAKLDALGRSTPMVSPSATRCS